MRGVKSYRDKTKVSKVVAGIPPSISISDSGTNTILKTSTSQNPNRASRSAPERERKDKTTPRQDNIFKRFTTLVIDFSKKNLYGLDQAELSMILSVQNMINVLLKTMSLMKY
jgi:hypothetical protein